jgi:hypothetical protein
VRVRITGGHTAGHAEYAITSGWQRLIAFGDALHSPIQVDHPEWSCVYDHDRARSAEHRRRLVAELEEPATIGFGIHFADVVFGQVRRDGVGPAWRPLDSPIAKRAAARLPTPVVLVVAAVVACAVMLTVSQADHLATMTAVLVAGGLSNGLVQPAAGRLIAARVPGHQRSLAAGTVGAALGAATLVPGLLVAPCHTGR